MTPTLVVEGGEDLSIGIVLPDADTPASVQRFEAGALADWSPDDTDTCDVVLTAPGVDEAAFLRAAAGSSEGRGDTGSAELMARTRLRIRTGTGEVHELAMPPFDIVERGTLTRLLEIANLDVRAEFRYHSTPFGDVANAADIVNGRVVRWEPGPQDDPEVTVGLAWAPNLVYRSGHSKPEDMLTPDGLGGARQHLMALLGLMISDEWVDAVRIDPDVGAVLVRWGTLWGSDAARAFFAQRLADMDGTPSAS